MSVNSTPNTTFASQTDGSHPSQFYIPEPQLPIYVTVYVTIINIVIFVIGVTGNVLVIVVVVKIKDMRTTMNLYLVNLSVADLLVLLVCQPSAMLEFYAKDRWYLGAVVCQLIPVLEHTVLHASTLTIVVITFERYHAICRPLATFLSCHRPRPMAALVCVWVIAITTSLPFMAMTHLKDDIFYDGTPCQLCITSVNRTWHYCFLLATTAVFFVFPLLLVSVLYSNIIHKLYRSDHVDGRISVNLKEFSGYNLRSRKQVIRMLATLVVVFFLSLSPLRVLIIWQIFSPAGSVIKMGIEGYTNLIWLCRMLMYVNSAGNPLIYSLLSSKFKIAFFFMLRCQSGMLEPRNRQRPHLLTVRSASRWSPTSSRALSIRQSNGSGCKHKALAGHSFTDKLNMEQMEYLTVDRNSCRRMSDVNTCGVNGREL